MKKTVGSNPVARFVAASSNPVGRQLFRIACLKYSRSGGSSVLGFRAGSL